MDELEPIFEWNMTRLEAKAFKLSIMWDKLSRIELPDYKLTKLRKKGDPRKSMLFKYCYKLAKETNGLIEDNEYRLYMQAQITILKNLKDGEVHALIGPECLAGRKAWNRWRVWKKKYDNAYQRTIITDADVQSSATESKVKGELVQAKQFLHKMFTNGYTYEDIERTIKDGIMVKWVTLGKICPYYVLVSPFVEKALNGEDFGEKFIFDLKIYKSSINQNIKNHFKLEFPEEFI